MSIVYLLQNQHDHYLNRAGEWVNGDGAASLFRTAHKDEAINQKVESSVKQIDQRIRVVEAELDEKRHPVVEVTAEPTAAQIKAKEEKENKGVKPESEECPTQTSLIEAGSIEASSIEASSAEPPNTTPTSEDDIREAV